MSTRILLLLVTATLLLHADTLILRNGNRVEGTFIDGGNHAVRFAVGSQINNYSLTDVESIRFGSGQTNDPSPVDTSQTPNKQSGGYMPAPAPMPVAASPNSPQTAPQSTPVAAAPASVPPAAGATNLQLPAGTQIVVRLIDDVNSERDNVGETYRASVDQDVVLNGQTAIPRGADATVALIDAQKSGKLEGKTVLTLDLKYIAVDGRTYDLATTGVAEASGSRGARSAKVIGGAAALGAIIGAAAGGGKGAAVGAGAGAAAGTAAQIATSGQKVKVPAETRLTFTLRNPLDL
ncbi:MAG TPA: hypothetical protein VMF91_08250 [Bryobacteraceae bacterium]|nr:hypothetical protein [Bryobacteraceae bacterium]